jgi:drug/metabolite transporter (DMT)-like permease
MQKKHVSEKALVGGMVISMFLWGLSWPSTKYLTHYCSAINFATYRYIIVVATLLFILFFTKTNIKIRKAGIPSILITGAMLAVYSYLFFKGLQKGAAGAGGVLVTTLNPIMSYFIGMLLSRKLPSGNESIGLVLGIIAGGFLLRIWEHPRMIFESGNLFFLLAAITWATMSKFTSRGHLYGAPLGFSLWQYIVTLLCLLPMMNMQEFHAVFHIKDPLFWMNVFFSSAIVTGLATTMFFYTTTRLGAEKASSFLFLVPFAAAFSSWLFLGERILLNTIIGGVLGMVAVYMINKRRPEIIVEPD